MIDIAILTSCINPNTDIFASGSIEQRTIDLIDNINFLNNKKIFDYIYIIDSSSKNFFLKNMKFKEYLIQKGMKYYENNKFFQLSPDFNLDKEIRKRGKGYSEMMMLLFVLNKIKKDNNEDIIFHKISGRYKILNINKLVEYNKQKLINSKSDIILGVSNFLEKTITYFYSFTSNLENNILKNKNKTEDQNKIYVEYLFYSDIFLNLFINSYRSRLLPIIDNNIKGGSTQGRLKLRRQIIKNTFYQKF